MNLISNFSAHLLVLLKALQLTKHQSTNGSYPGAVDPAAASGSQSFQASPPFYPSPWMTPGTTGWAEAYEKSIAFVGQLTLLEKVGVFFSLRSFLV